MAASGEDARALARFFGDASLVESALLRASREALGAPSPRREAVTLSLLEILREPPLAQVLRRFFLAQVTTADDPHLGFFVRAELFRTTGAGPPRRAEAQRLWERYLARADALRAIALPPSVHAELAQSLDRSSSSSSADVPATLFAAAQAVAFCEVEMTYVPAFLNSAAFAAFTATARQGRTLPVDRLARRSVSTRKLAFLTAAVDAEDEDEGEGEGEGEGEAVVDEDEEAQRVVSGFLRGAATDASAPVRATDDPDVVFLLTFLMGEGGGGGDPPSAAAPTAPAHSVAGAGHPSGGSRWKLFSRALKRSGKQALIRAQSDERVVLSVLNLVSTEPFLAHLFRRYLQQLVADESLAFFLDVEEFRQQPTCAGARAVWERYLAANAPRAVNVAGTARAEASAAAELPALDTPAPTPGMFDACQQEVVLMLQMGVVPQFLGSEVYTRYRAIRKRGWLAGRDLGAFTAELVPRTRSTRQLKELLEKKPCSH